jgi:hypothetical protein
MVNIEAHSIDKTGSDVEGMKISRNHAARVSRFGRSLPF